MAWGAGATAGSVLEVGALAADVHLEIARIQHRGCVRANPRGRLGRLDEDLNHDSAANVDESARPNADVRHARQRTEAAAMPVEEVGQSNDLIVPAHGDLGLRW